MSKKEPVKESPKIKLNVHTIFEKINSNGLYDFEGVKVINSFNIKNFLASILSNDNKYLGFLSPNLIKNSIGIQTFSNGDKYFGTFTNDIMSGRGIYQFNPTQENPDSTIKKYEFFFGDWSSNQISKNGIYFWINKSPDKDLFAKYDNSEFEFFTGQFRNSLFFRGTYCVKKGENEYYVYHGNFEGSKKNGTNCLYYSFKDDIVLFGNYLNDIFDEGYIFYFNKDNGNLKKCAKKEKGSIEIVKDVNLIKNVIDNIITFRSIIIKKDHFFKCFIIFKRIVKLFHKIDSSEIDEGLKCLNDEEQYKIIDEFLSSYIDLDMNKLIKKIKFKKQKDTEK